MSGRCSCPCRHRYRILSRAKPHSKSHVSPEEEIINIDALYATYKEKNEEKKGEYSLNECVVEHMTISTIDSNMERLLTCQCCERHQNKSI